MLDFFMVATRIGKKDIREVYPKFIVRRSNDLMIRGGDFYAVWVEERGLWSTDEQDALNIIDRELDRYAKDNAEHLGGMVRVLHMWDAESGMIDRWHKYCQSQVKIQDSYHVLDERIIFADEKTDKKDYSSKKLPYALKKGDCPSWERMMSVLYSPEERHKIEWAIGSVVTGASRDLQKFLVLYGGHGTGKSTVLNVIKALFDGYCCTFKATDLGSASKEFALEQFRSNPLIAIDTDGKLSKIDDNTRLNTIVSHEPMVVNEKFKSTYTARFQALLLIGTNEPVKITDAKSGLIRRLIDVSPSGNLLSRGEYDRVTSQVLFELGSIAYHCKEVFEEDPYFYDHYIPTAMLSASNDFYNFVLDSYYVFAKDNQTTLKAAYEMYKTYCEESKVPYPMQRRIFKEELKNYFEEYRERFDGGEDGRLRNGYFGFKKDKFEYGSKREEAEEENWLKFDKSKSLFDDVFADCPAQYTKEDGTPEKSWTNVTTTLSDLDTGQTHYVLTQRKYPALVTVDFDIPDEGGNKCYERNLREASKWTPTYAELSKSGEGIHLEYFYDGDVSKLSPVFKEHVEIKIFSGNLSLRRKVSKCNDIPIATISSGLPLKEEKPVINYDTVKSEIGLRKLVERNLRKEIHPGTKSSVDFIYKILDDAYNSELKYDISDMFTRVLGFAAGSTHNSDYCIKLVNKMKFKSDELNAIPDEDDGDGIVFYDVEVFPNLFVVCYKVWDSDPRRKVVKMINPSSSDIEALMRRKLVGFNCRRYDNHIIYARLLGFTNEKLYALSQRIINDGEGFFGEAYNVSYTDIYDFSAVKQSLKKFEIELGIHHQELGLPWDKPVPKKLWEKVADYCVNDVLATEAVFNARQADFTARKILADLSGLTVNDTTRMHITKILVGNDKNPIHVYTDLATGVQSPTLEETTTTAEINSFPGYKFERLEDGKYHNMFRGTDVGFGGYVYAEPGMYHNVALLDVGNMHGASILQLNKFGKYTRNYKEIRDARMAIKHGIKTGDFSEARKMLGGKLAKYLVNEQDADDLQNALKLVLNSTYGIAAATFKNPLRDERDVNNIIALRGALFMRTLQDEVTSRGFRVVHIKTDSIKIPNASDDIIKFIIDFGKKYGYEFEHEATYDRMCLVNDAVYIAKYDDKGNRSKGGKHANEWTATGKQFQVPYVFKTLFSKEDIRFEDLCETKSVSTAIYIDKDGEGETEDDSSIVLAFGEDGSKHYYHFVGRVGQFCPMLEGAGGGDLVREKDGKYYAVTGSKGYKWMESEIVKQLDKQDQINVEYYDKMVEDAKAAISEYGDFDRFVSDEPFSDFPPDDDDLPF